MPQPIKPICKSGTVYVCVCMHVCVSCVPSFVGVCGCSIIEYVLLIIKCLCVSFATTCSPPGVVLWSMLLIPLVFYFVLFVLFLLVLCLVLMLHLSLCCTIVFSNIYFVHYTHCVLLQVVFCVEGAWHSAT